MVEATDVYNIVVDQPSWSRLRPSEIHHPITWAEDDQVELLPDLIIFCHGHPAILAWEEDRGNMNRPLATGLAALETSWNNIDPRESLDDPSGDYGTNYATQLGFHKATELWNHPNPVSASSPPRAALHLRRYTAARMVISDRGRVLCFGNRFLFDSALFLAASPVSAPPKKLHKRFNQFTTKIRNHVGSLVQIVRVQ